MLSRGVRSLFSRVPVVLQLRAMATSEASVELFEAKIVAALRETGGKMDSGKLRQICGPPPAGSGKFMKFFTARPAIFEVDGRKAISLVDANHVQDSRITTTTSTATENLNVATYADKIVAALKQHPEFGGWVEGEISQVVLQKLREVCGPPPAGVKFIEAFTSRSDLFTVTWRGNEGQLSISLKETMKIDTTSDIEKPPVVDETTGTSTSSSTILLVDTAQKLAEVRLSDQVFTPSDSPVSDLDVDLSASSDARTIVSIDCEFTQKRQDPTSIVSWNPEDVVDELCLIQVATSKGTYIFDCIRLTPQTVCDVLRPLLASSNCIKLFHDIHKDAHCLHFHGGIDSISCVFDTQLAAEALRGGMLVSFSELLQGLGLPEHSSKRHMSQKFALDPRSFWKLRPLSDDQIDYAAQDVGLLLEAGPILMARLGKEGVDAVIAASRTRAEARMQNAELQRSVCFDPSRNFALASAELLSSTHRDMHEMRPITVESEASDFVSLLPPDLRTKFHDGEYGVRIDMNQLRDIVLDVGRRPIGYTVSAARILLSDSEEREVTRADIEFVTSKIGGFGSDNRAAMDGKLHRISAIRDRDGQQVTGLTMRYGRYVQGTADMILDVLATDKSILILGEPGSGKTTIVREVTRILAEKQAVVVIDTSNGRCSTNARLSFAMSPFLALTRC